MTKHIFVNGTFDILHVGHIRLLTFARSFGDVLHVAIDSDRRVTKLKGTSRPINKQDDRREMLQSLRCVDSVYVFDTDTDLIDLIAHISPDVMVVGGDWKGRQIIGSEGAGRIEYFERIDGYSTTQTIQNIVDR